MVTNCIKSRLWLDHEVVNLLFDSLHPTYWYKSDHHIYCGARQVGYKAFWLTLLKKIKYKINIWHPIIILCFTTLISGSYNIYYYYRYLPNYNYNIMVNLKNFVFKHVGKILNIIKDEFMNNINYIIIP